MNVMAIQHVEKIKSALTLLDLIFVNVTMAMSVILILQLSALVFTQVAKVCSH